jgi:hypothetical protein
VKPLETRQQSRRYFDTFNCKTLYNQSSLMTTPKM